MKFATHLALAVWLSGGLISPAATQAASVKGWLNWRGPNQNGTSLEKNLPSYLKIGDSLWTADFPGASTPVVANGKLYIVGYVGEIGRASCRERV